jgi:subtilase family serine protease
MMFCGWAVTALSQTGANQRVNLDRIIVPIDEARAVTLAGNVHPLARGEFDDGAVSAETALDRMVLELEPSAAQQTELDALLEAQHDPGSPLYHQWLTPVEFGSRFGASAGDLARITSWLAGHGFVVDEVAASGRLVVFSGNAGIVADTFHTEIHRYVVNGVRHIGNAQDPQIPEALAGVVGGVVSLHDFRRASEIRARTEISSSSVARPQYSSGGTHYLFPADWATIYDLNSLYSAGTKGTGTSIAIVGRSNINLSDVAQFRSTSGLTANNPTVILVGANPGLVSGDQDESTLDVEWSGAVAPAATVKFVVGASTQITDGVDLSAQYIVNHATAPVVSTSYGSCEQDMGASELAFYNALWEQAASQGMSAFVSSGDSGASGCNSGSSSAGSGKAVNGLCSSPYSTCVGGTEFNEGSNPAQYWSATNTASYGSALGYIPEKVWNESGSNGGSGLWSSGGGASVVYPEPAWQKAVSGTSAANGMRAVPDVAMAAAGHDGYIIYENGSLWVIAGTSAASPSFAGVMALVVQSKGGTGQGNANAGLYPLVNAARNPFHSTPSGNNSVPGVVGFTASGGTYNLATGLGSVDGALLVGEWGGGTNTGVDFTLTASATTGTVQVGKTATFTLSVTESGAGKNAVALTAKTPAGITVGFSPTSITPGTSTAVTITVAAAASSGSQTITLTGTDGSGTQNVTYSLTVTPAPTLTIGSASTSLSVVQGKTITDLVSLTGNATYAGAVTLGVSGLPSGVTASWSGSPVTFTGESGSSTLTLTASSIATVGSATITVTANGDGLTASKQIEVQVTKAPAVAPTLTVMPASTSLSVLQGRTVTDVVSLTGNATYAGPVTLSATGLPSGVTASWSGNPVTLSAENGSSTLTLIASSAASLASATITVTATGDAVSASKQITVQVTPPPTLTIGSASTSLSVVQGKTVTDVVSFTGNATYAGAVTLTATGLPSGVTASWSSNPVTLSGENGSSTLTFTASSVAIVESATITLTANGDGLTASKQITVQVTKAPAIAPTLAATPASTSVSVVQGKTAMDVISLTANSTYAGAVTLSATGLPSGVTASWSSNPVTLSGDNGSSTLTLTASSVAIVGSATITVTANGDGLTASKQITVQVTQAPAVQLTLSASTLSMVHTSAGAITLTVKASGGLIPEGSFMLGGLPAGITPSISNVNTATSGSMSLTLAFTGSAAAKAGASTVTITVTCSGSGGSSSAAQELSLVLK